MARTAYLRKSSEVDAWDSGTTYVIGDWVNHSATLYRCILGNTNQTPPNATYWTTTNLYGSLATWTASLNRGTNGEETGQIEGPDNFAESLTIAAATSGTDRIILTVTDDDYHARVPGAGARNVLAQNSTSYPLRVSAGYVTVEKFETSSGLDNRYVYWYTGTHGVLRRCLIHAKNSTGGAYDAFVRFDQAHGEMHECAQWSEHGENQEGIRTQALTVTVSHCAVSNNLYYGIRESSTSPTDAQKMRVDSCACLGNGTAVGAQYKDFAFNNAFHASCDNNTSQDGTHPGSNGVTVSGGWAALWKNANPHEEDFDLVTSREWENDLAWATGFEGIGTLAARKWGESSGDHTIAINGGGVIIGSNEIKCTIVAGGGATYSHRTIQQETDAWVLFGVQANAAYAMADGDAHSFVLLTNPTLATNLVLVHLRRSGSDYQVGVQHLQPSHATTYFGTGTRFAGIPCGCSFVARKTPQSAFSLVITGAAQVGQRLTITRRRTRTHTSLGCWWFF